MQSWQNGAGTLSVLDAISMPPLNVAEVRTGRAGLAYRHVRWVQVMHWPAHDFVRPGDLVLTTAVAPSTQAARDFLEAVVRSDAAALIVSLPHSSSPADILDPAVELARTEQFPLLVLPWEVPFADVTRVVTTRLLRTGCQVDDAVCGLRHLSVPVRSSEVDMSAELSRAMAMRADSADVEVALGHPSQSADGRRGYERFMQALSELTDAQRPAVRVCERPDVCLLVQERHEGRPSLRELLDEARRRSGERTMHWVVADARSGERGHGDQPRPVEVARKMMADRDDWVDSQSLESLFVLGALAQSPLTSTVVNEAVGALVSYDRDNRRNLLETLQVYLDESCNTSAAARRLFLNRHSLMYRLRKIEELTGFSLKEPADRFFLQACVRLQRYRLLDDASSEPR